MSVWAHTIHVPPAESLCQWGLDIQVSGKGEVPHHHQKMLQGHCEPNETQWG